MHSFVTPRTQPGLLQILLQRVTIVLHAGGMVPSRGQADWGTSCPAADRAQVFNLHKSTPLFLLRLPQGGACDMHFAFGDMYCVYVHPHRLSTRRPYHCVRL